MFAFSCPGSSWLNHTPSYKVMRLCHSPTTLPPQGSCSAAPHQPWSGLSIIHCWQDRIPINNAHTIMFYSFEHNCVSPNVPGGRVQPPSSSPNNTPRAQEKSRADQTRAARASSVGLSKTPTGPISSHLCFLTPQPQAQGAPPSPALLQARKRLVRIPAPTCEPVALPGGSTPWRLYSF